MADHPKPDPYDHDPDFPMHGNVIFMAVVHGVLDLAELRKADPDEAERHWREWREFIATPEGRKCIGQTADG